MTVSKKIGKNIKKITISDSYCILNDSLDKLCKNFDTITKKSIFPYKFAKRNTLFYKGIIPSYNYFNDITIAQYTSMYNDNWSFKDETIKYLNNDLNSLYEVITKVNKQVFNDYNVNIMDKVTISSLALDIFIKRYYKDNIPLVNKTSMYKDIKEGYYGGKTEVYIPTGNNLYYYDVNSLYPYVALNDMPGLKCYELHFFEGQTIQHLFGFFYCDVESPKDIYFGLLPLRNKEGINFAKGKWKGWYFSEEIKYAQDNGYKINVIKGYSFSREKNVFSNYISKIYEIKTNPVNKTQKSFAKSLLNNLLGRFGISLDKDITEIVTKSRFNTISIMYKIISYHSLDDNNYIVSYIPKLDPDIIESHGLDLIKIANKYKDKEVQSMNVASIPISAAITAYARIHMSKIKKHIESLGGKVYYTDTDSIVIYYV